jgi:hypothetical protein
MPMLMPMLMPMAMICCVISRKAVPRWPFEPAPPVSRIPQAWCRLSSAAPLPSPQRRPDSDEGSMASRPSVVRDRAVAAAIS